MAVKDIKPAVLSGSTTGEPITVAATASAGTTIHTVTGGVGQADMVTLYASNTHTGDVLLWIQWGGTAANNLLGPFLLRANSGDHLIVESKALQSGKTIRAYASVASVVNITGDAPIWEFG